MTSTVTVGGVFQNEIRSMMHVFGDVANGSSEVASIIEEVTQRQIREVVRHAVEITSIRGGSSVTKEDVLFLLRGNKEKLRRMIKLLELRDLIKRAKSQSRSDEEDDEESEEPSEDPLAVEKTSKRLKLSLDFLSTADQIEVLNSKEADDITLQRNERLDKLTQSMSPQQYLQYTTNRQAKFHKNISKFIDWIDVSSITQLSVPPIAMELFSHLAQETVQEIVELSLLVKREQDNLSLAPPLPSSLPPLRSPTSSQVPMTFLSSPDSPLASPRSPAELTPVSPMVSRTRHRKRGRPPKQSIAPVTIPATASTTPEPPSPPPHPSALQPSHVREALRRHSALHTPMALFSTHRIKPSFKQQTFCL